MATRTTQVTTEVVTTSNKVRTTQVVAEVVRTSQAQPAASNKAHSKAIWVGLK